MASLRAVALGTLVFLAPPAAALAETFGPACWTMTPGGDVFRLVFQVDLSGARVASVSGTTASDSSASPFLSAVSGNAISVGGTPEFIAMGLTAMPRPQGITPARSPMFVNVVFNFNTLIGSGYCTGEGCGEGKSFTWTLAPCP